MKFLIILMIASLPLNYLFAKETEIKRDPANIANIGGVTMETDHSGRTRSVLNVVKIDQNTTCYFVSTVDGGVSNPVCKVNGKIVLSGSAQ